MFKRNNNSNNSNNINSNNNNFNLYDLESNNNRIVINDDESSIIRDPELSVNQNNSSQNQNGNKLQACIMKLLEKLQIPSNYKLFFLFLILSFVNFFSALFRLPFIILSPNNLLNSLSFGNIFLLISFLFYYGGSQFLSFLRDEKRFNFIFIHLLIVCFALFCPIFKKYFLALLLDAGLLVTTVMFILTLLPGGQGGVNAIKSSLLNTLLSMFSKFKK